MRLLVNASLRQLVRTMISSRTGSFTVIIVGVRFRENQQQIVPKPLVETYHSLENRNKSRQLKDNVNYDEGDVNIHRYYRAQCSSCVIASSESLDKSPSSREKDPTSDVASSNLRCR